jgi:hypothetical protein
VVDGVTPSRLIVTSGLSSWVLLSYSVAAAPRTWWTVLIMTFVALIFTVPVSIMKASRE